MARCSGRASPASPCSRCSSASGSRWRSHSSSSTTTTSRPRRRRRRRAAGLEDAAAGRLQADAGGLRAAAARLARLEARSSSERLCRRRTRLRGRLLLGHLDPRRGADRLAARARAEPAHASTSSRRSSTSTARARSSSAATTASCTWSARRSRGGAAEVHADRERQARVPVALARRLLNNQRPASMPAVGEVLEQVGARDDADRAALAGDERPRSCRR